MKQAGVEPSVHLLEALALEAAEHAERVSLEATERAELERLGTPRYELPLAADGVDVGTLYHFAQLLRDQRMVA